MDDLPKLWTQAYSLLAERIRDYRLNAAFYANAQNVEWDPTSHEVRVAASDDRRPAYKANLIRSRVERLVGKIVSQPLEFYCLPTGGDDISRGKALNSQQLLRWRSEVANWNGLRAQNAKAFILGSTSFIAVEPDPEGVEKLSLFAIDEATLEPGVRDPLDARWWMSHTLLPVEQVETIYGVKVTASPNTTPAVGPRITSNSLGNLKLVGLYKYYERPNPKAPEGRVVHATHNQVLWESPWPFPSERLNVFVFRQTQVHGTWIGLTIVSDARSVQIQYNDLRRTVLEHAELFRGKLLIPEGSIDTDEWTTDPREPMWYNAGFGAPTFMTPPSMPRLLLEQSNLLVQEIDEQLFTHEPSRGISPGDRFSGTAIAALNEYNNSPLVTMLRDERSQWAELAKYVIGMYAAKPGDALWKAVMDDHGIVTAHEWSPLMFDPEVRVVVRSDGDTPQSPTVTQARLAELAAQFPQLAESIDAGRLLQLLNLPGADTITSNSDADARLAQWENLQISVGRVLMPRPFEDHAIHIAEHNWQRKQPEYYTWSQERQQLLTDHIAAHEQMLRMETLQQMTLNQVQPGLAGMPQADEPVGSSVPQPKGIARNV